MQQISQEELQQLNSTKLALRINNFFHEDYINRYGKIPDGMESVALSIDASAILHTTTLQNSSEEIRKRALLFFFRSQFQISLCDRYLGIENHLIHAKNESDNKWTRPNVQIVNAAIRQTVIVAARTAFECLMEFVYLIENQKLIPSSRSKLNKFSQWCCSANNRFGWLVFYILAIRRYDQNHRTPEIHGTSYIAIEALQCRSWPRAAGELDAINMMLNIWPFIIQTMNGRHVRSYSCSERDQDIFEEFHNWSQINLEDFHKHWLASFNAPPSSKIN